MHSTATAPRIAIFGASGRMGRRISLLLETEFPGKAQVAARVDSANSTAALPATLDAILDFSLPDGTAALVGWLETQPGPLPVLVSGTTGLDEALLRRMRRLGERTGVIHASNFAPGVAVLRKLLASAAPLLRQLGYTPVLTEVHHVHKQDAPSGTARTLLQAIDPEQPGRTATHSVRAGEIIGRHDVVFYGPSDRITLGHEALDRDLFARGAIEAALWLVTQPQPAGWLSLDDYLEARAGS